MREAEYWVRLRRHVGDSYASLWAESVVHTGLGDRTAAQALAAGMDVRRIWLATWSNLELPDSAK
ncbi:MAG: DUF3046 domain-containing protein [Propionibacteriaceae bacterium]|nr:DUF3046 domain-containing protein [Propionibacteriaceae bacterium]